MLVLRSQTPSRPSFFLPSSVLAPSPSQSFLTKLKFGVGDGNLQVRGLHLPLICVCDNLQVRSLVVMHAVHVDDIASCIHSPFASCALLLFLELTLFLALLTSLTATRVPTLPHPIQLCCLLPATSAVLLVQLGVPADGAAGHGPRLAVGAAAALIMSTTAAAMFIIIVPARARVLAC